MNAKESVPELWPATRWRLRLTHRGDKRSAQTYRPKRPFLLIGSADHCDIRLDDPQVPAVAYLFCCFRDCVEAWPTSAIAFPRWGVVRPGQEIAIGQTRVTIDRPSTSSQDQTALADSPPRASVPIQVFWGRKSRKCQLKRAVTIMGRDQPSVLRLQGQCLSPCDHALVANENQLWLINLATPSALTPDSFVTCLSDQGDAGQIGSVTIALRSAGVELPGDTSNLRIKHAVHRRPAIIRAFRAGELDDPETSDTRESSKTGLTHPLPMELSVSTPPRIAASGIATSGIATSGIATSGIMERRRAEVRRVNASDRLASRVTDRLVRMSRQKNPRSALLNSILARVLKADTKAA